MVQAAVAVAVGSTKNEIPPALQRRDLEPVYESIKALFDTEYDAKLILKKAVEISFLQTQTQKNEITRLVNALKPWRKGPFKVNDHFIDSEWQSYMKFDLLRPVLEDIKGKDVADIGCNNGYYMFKMLEFSPRSLTGFDPSAKFYLQFLLMNAFLKTSIVFELLGVQDLPEYQKKFDTIFALGILYHRRDPISTLKELKSGLKSGGTLVLDTLYIEDEREIALTPRKTYAKMSNVFFIPSILALRNWCERAGFSEFEVFAKSRTTTLEQRTSSYSSTQSLKDFLSKDGSKSCEGYDAPRRVYIKARG